MPRSTRKPVSPPKRMADYRQRMRAAGLRPVQIWVPDTRSPDFVEACRRQSRAVAADDPAGDEIMRFVASVYEWPEP
ncbi:MAG: antitoxin MazE family protein [Beijerinckiaceae bacterium]